LISLFSFFYSLNAHLNELWKFRLLVEIKSLLLLFEILEAFSVKNRSLAITPFLLLLSRRGLVS